MGADYIPERDLDAVMWLRNFARRLALHPELYHAAPAEVERIESAVLAFRVAHANCRPSHRTRPRVAAKCDARRSAERVVRPAAQRIRVDADIPPAAKIDIGLKPAARRRRRIGPPDSTPIVQANADPAGFIDLRVSDSVSLGRGKPRGAVAYELYEQIGPWTGQTTVPDEQPWRFVGVFTVATCRIYPTAATFGQGVWLKARWVTRRGEVSEFGNVAAVPVLGAALHPNPSEQHRRRFAA